jgi:hypothetical protein
VAALSGGGAATWGLGGHACGGSSWAGAAKVATATWWFAAGSGVDKGGARVACAGARC